MKWNALDLPFILSTLKCLQPLLNLSKWNATWTYNIFNISNGFVSFSTGKFAFLTLTRESFRFWCSKFPSLIHFLHLFTLLSDCLMFNPHCCVTFPILHLLYSLGTFFCSLGVSLMLSMIHSRSELSIRRWRQWSNLRKMLNSLSHFLTFLITVHSSGK